MEIRIALLSAFLEDSYPVFSFNYTIALWFYHVCSIRSVNIKSTFILILLAKLLRFDWCIGIIMKVNSCNFHHIYVLPCTLFTMIFIENYLVVFKHRISFIPLRNSKNSFRFAFQNVPFFLKLFLLFLLRFSVLL